MPIEISKIKALCFDVDGTLSDTDNLYTEQLRHFLFPFLFRNPEHTARRMVMWSEAPGNALLGYADRIGLDNQMVAVINWLSLHRKNSSKKFLLVPGVDELLKQLHGQYPMAVVSARDENSTMVFLEQFGLAKYFDVIVTGLSAEHTKPYPDPVLLAAKRMNVAPENCVMIGDTTVDIRAGNSAGAQTVGVLCGFGEEPELQRLGAGVIIKSTSNLMDVLK